MMNEDSYFLPIASGKHGNLGRGIPCRSLLWRLYGGTTERVLWVRAINRHRLGQGEGQFVYCTVSVGEFQDRTEMVPYRDRLDFFGPFDRHTLNPPHGDWDLFEVVAEGRLDEMFPEQAMAAGFVRACDEGTIDQWLGTVGDTFDPKGLFAGKSLTDIVVSNDCGIGSYRRSYKALRKLIELGVPVTSIISPGWGMSLLEVLARDAADPDLLAAAQRLAEIETSAEKDPPAPPEPPAAPAPRIWRWWRRRD